MKRNQVTPEERETQKTDFDVGGKIITCWVEERSGVPVLVVHADDHLVIRPGFSNQFYVG